MGDACERYMTSARRAVQPGGVCGRHGYEGARPEPPGSRTKDAGAQQIRKSGEREGVEIERAGERKSKCDQGHESVSLFFRKVFKEIGR